MKPSPRSVVPRLITSSGLRTVQRRFAAVRRRIFGRAQPVVQLFHQVDDPYSALLARSLVHLETSYGVRIEPHLVSAPDAAAAPDRERLTHWSLRDATTLAAGTGLAPTVASPPDAAQLAHAQALLAACTSAAEFERVSGLIEQAWSGGRALPAGLAQGNAAAALARGDARRKALGHYLGGMLHFEGEWYWGLDRLGHLEARLEARAGMPVPFVPRREVSHAPKPAPAGTVIEAFVSLRSPYTYLAVPRITRLAQATGARLRLRPVLPMVMRGLPVPVSKRLYIIRDTKREAERLGMAFGTICDPVGAPAERGLAVLHHAIEAGQGEAFLLSFLQGVFAEGVDAGGERGLAHLCARAGIGSQTMQAALADPSWRTAAEQARADMLAAGLWGVPSFRVIAPDGQPRAAHWGQDRLWAIEDDLAALSA